LEKLEAYPEWKDKVVEEVGKWFLMIHNNLAEGDTKRDLFSKLVNISPFRTGRSTSSDPAVALIAPSLLSPNLPLQPYH
jgi:hypothetical protein